MTLSSSTPTPFRFLATTPAVGGLPATLLAASCIEIALGTGELAPLDAIVLVFPSVLFIAYSPVAHSLLRLVIGGTRELRAA